MLQWSSQRALGALALICPALALGACGSGSDDSPGDGSTGTAFHPNPIVDASNVDELGPEY